VKSEAAAAPLASRQVEERREGKNTRELYNCQKQPFRSQWETTISERHFASPSGETQYIKNGHISLDFSCVLSGPSFIIPLSCSKDLSALCRVWNNTRKAEGS